MDAPPTGLPEESMRTCAEPFLDGRSRRERPLTPLREIGPSVVGDQRGAVPRDLRRGDLYEGQ